VVYDFFRSIKLAVVLLIIIAALSALSTFVPQGEVSEYYRNIYSSFFAQLIVGIGFHQFFRSALFLIPAGLFFVNLAICTVDRVVRRARGGRPRRFGPDLIHLGILILMIGGIISLIGKREGYLYLSEGEYAELPDGYQLVLNSFEHTTYEDGRPKDYVSSVEVVYGDEKIGSYAIRVNKPLRVGKLKIYQDSHTSTTTIILKDDSGGHYPLSPGEGFRVENRLYFFMGIEPGSLSTKGMEEEGSSPVRDSMIVFEELDEGGMPVDRHIVGFRDKIDRFIIDDIFTTDQTGLRVVRDSGFLPVLASFIIIGIGLVLTFAQKIGEKAP
jgi:cytochrome c biogenesis protein